jgi:hypothetical protein
MKMAGKVFKVAISAALRYNIDLNNDGKADMKMECTIDPKALLGSDDPHFLHVRCLHHCFLLSFICLFGIIVVTLRRET